MQTTNMVHWFEIPTANLDNAKMFYESVFQVPLTRVSMDDAEMEWFPQAPMGCPGATGALIHTTDFTPAKHGTVVYLTVHSLDDTLERTKQYGGKIFKDKADIGEYGYIAIIEDSEGNRVGVHMEKMTQKDKK